MDAAVLVETLKARGVTLEAHGDKLRWTPRDALTPGEVERLRQHKRDIMEVLSHPDTDDVVGALIAEAQARGVRLRLNPGPGAAFFASPASKVTPDLATKLREHTLLVAAELIRRRWPCTAPGCTAEGMYYVMQGDASVLRCERHQEDD